MLPNLPEEFVWPDYAGGSIGNIPATVAQLLGAPFKGLPPLRDELWRPLGDDVRRVMLVVFDAMGWNLVQSMTAEFEPLTRRAAVTGQITSIFPSTTVAALTSIWTGVAPAQHGLVSFHMFLSELGVVGQMINLTPAFMRLPDSLVTGGLKPEKFIAAPSVASQLLAADIPTYSFKGADIVNSALSKMHGRQVSQSFGAFTAADMFTQTREFLERSQGKSYSYVYWPTIDTLSHVHGWNSPHVRAELRSLLLSLQTELLDSLSPAARKGTVVILTADHGQLLTDPQKRLYIDRNRKLYNKLLMRPSGEPRSAFLYARQGEMEAALAHFQRTFGDISHAVASREALASGLFGPTPHDPATAVRVGDVTALMRENYMLMRSAQKEEMNRMVGFHGGMTAAEMQVPWLAFRLDE
jgi:predicted AlkP superfamily pyrophosphatase or phosphodiesterase